MTTFVFPDIPGQMGLASTRQLLKAGASEWDLTQLALRGQRVVRAVYRSGTGQLTPRQLLIAGSLWAGDHAVLTGGHALVVHGLLDDLDPLARPRYLVPPQHRARRNAVGMVSERTRNMPRHQLVEGLRVARPDRALVDAAVRREVTDSRLKMITMTLLQRRRTTLERLADEIGVHGDANTGPVQDGMLAFTAGAWSPPEEVLINAIRADGRFPTMDANPVLERTDGRFIGTPDGYFADSGVIVQVHSKRFHTGEEPSGEDRFARTLARDTDYQAYGLVVVGVAPETLDHDLPGFLSNLLLIIAAHEGRGPKHVRIRRAVPASA